MAKLSITAVSRVAGVTRSTLYRATQRAAAACRSGRSQAARDARPLAGAGQATQDGLR